jgi:hypothetical protein
VLCYTIEGIITQVDITLNIAYGSNGIGYSQIKFYCMNYGYEHREYACPKCGSKAVRTG